VTGRTGKWSEDEYIKLKDAGQTHGTLEPIVYRAYKAMHHCMALSDGRPPKWMPSRKCCDRSGAPWSDCYYKTFDSAAAWDCVNKCGSRRQRPYSCWPIACLPTNMNVPVSSVRVHGFDHFSESHTQICSAAAANSVMRFLLAGDRRIFHLFRQRSPRNRPRGNWSGIPDLPGGKRGMSYLLGRLREHHQAALAARELAEACGTLSQQPE
jgi:hypothetical protein